MADDEGADYWANVYGQPIHTYPRTRPSASGGGGALESMSDAEYTSYVRARMWERTHQHIAAERARRDEARRTAQQQQREHQRRRARAETAAFERRLDESLRRGAERKREKGWAERWETYGAQWDRIREARDIPWPVESGRARDLWREEIERFFVNGHRAGKVGLVGAEAKTALWKVLRAERVRWHPDKIQQRFGAHGVDAETMKAVTAVFQVVDRMFREAKGTE
ncbi:MAG: hypothetical protein M1829_001574 [Trizodia sp. TS-e1964]|nr:MAG: hypothetical protein M1829_001574 [Trizodia sp. TS-e1964]